MTSFLVAEMAPLMFAALVVFLLIGYPVAFSLAFVGLAFGALGIELGLLDFALMQALPERVFGIMRNDTLLAIPFFTFMGLILERSGMAEDLLNKGESRHARARAVAFHRLGRLRDRTAALLQHRASALALVTGAIALWNTWRIRGRVAAPQRETRSDKISLRGHHSKGISREAVCGIGRVRQRDFGVRRGRNRPAGVAGALPVHAGGDRGRGPCQGTAT